MQYNFAVVGATGMVGRKILEVIAERNLPVKNLYLFASEKSDGLTLSFRGKDIEVHAITENNVPAVDYAIFSAGAAVSGKFAPLFRDKGAVVIDNSSMFRKNIEVPLVVPEVNPNKLRRNNGIIANPNCSTIQAVVTLAPIFRKYGLKKISYTTFQSVSGAGRRGFVDLINGLHGIPPKVFPREIFANVIPAIGDFDRNGYTTEENKMIFETKKILGCGKIAISATCVRVPVFFCHSESVIFTTKKSTSVNALKQTLSSAPGVALFDNDENFPTPADAEGKDEVFVGRLRQNTNEKNTFSVWIVADNVRKGAATNAVQIAEKLIYFRENVQ